MKITNKRPAWLEIDIEMVRKNIRSVQSYIGESKICAVIKANAYGHGCLKIAEIAAQEGCSMLAVATYDEGMELRTAGITMPILCLSPMGEQQFADAIKNDIRLTLYNLVTAQKVSEEAQRQGKKAIIHLKVDSGMSRVGMKPALENVDMIKGILSLPSLICEGIYTHFANADGFDKSHTLGQIAKFNAFCNLLRENGISFEIYHACNSGGIIDFPQAHFDMVRPGILLYGYYPSDGVNKKALMLFPALSVKAQITMVKTIQKGTFISYGCKYCAPKDSLIATLPLGYADGIPYAYAEEGEVLINGKRLPIVGTICMDQMMVDVTALGTCEEGAEAVLIGRQNDENITLEEFAAHCHTIKYEILTGFNSRLCEKYIND